MRLFPLAPVLAVGLTWGGVACSQAAAVFLDIPPKAPPSGSQQRAVPVRWTAFEVDTIRPPIELVASADSALSLLPADAEGNVDWVKAMRTGVISPRTTPPGSPPAADLSGFAYDFSFEGPDAEFDASFPHSVHAGWLRCQSCHQGGRRAAKPPTMDEINEGKGCGQCHGTVAFPAGTCYRCHTNMEQPTEMAEKASMPAEPVKFVRAGTTVGLTPDFPIGAFSHFSHRIRYTCAACHDGLFPMEAGVDTLTMAQMQGGKSCGRCHDGTAAFAVMDCDRCHVAPPGKGAGAPAAPAGPANAPGRRH